jgi:hypothetical protein
MFKPENPNSKAILYIHPSGKSVEASDGGEIEWFVKNGFIVLAPDLIGTGETGPGSFKGDAVILGVSNNMWFTSIITGRSIAGIRAGDIIRLRMLLSNIEGIKEIYGFARKEMAPVMLYASAFDREIARIALIEPYSSYRSIVMNRFYNMEFVHNLVAGALTEYDLPDLAAALAPRKLLITGTTDGNNERKDPQSIGEDLAIIKNVYQVKNAASQLILEADPGVNLKDRLTGWMK